jgi:hypothetical protein
MFQESLTPVLDQFLRIIGGLDDWKAMLERVETQHGQCKRILDTKELGCTLALRLLSLNLV